VVRLSSRQPNVVSEMCEHRETNCQPCRRWRLALSHKQDLLAVARRRPGCREDAEDAVAEAMLRAVTFDGLDEDRIGAWMTRTLMNLCADRGRDLARGPQRHAYSIRMSLPAPGPEEQVTERLHATYATEQVGALPDGQREALLLKASGIPVGDVARRMGLGYKATESLLSRARATLRLSLVAGVAAVLARIARKAATPLPLATFALVGAMAALVTSSAGQSPVTPSPETEVVSETGGAELRRRPSPLRTRHAVVPDSSGSRSASGMPTPASTPSPGAPPAPGVGLDAPLEAAETLAGLVEEAVPVDEANAVASLPPCPPSAITPAAIVCPVDVPADAPRSPG